MDKKNDYNYSKTDQDLTESEKFTAEEAQNFWRSPTPKNAQDKGLNNPIDYLSFDDNRSPVLLEIIEKYCDQKDLKILELGPNAGRNLNYLYQHGLTDVHGIEINADAISLLNKTFPHLAGNVKLSSLEDELPSLDNNEFDLIFSMAVLEHISNESDFILEEIKRVSSRFIITIEDEITSWSERHFQRNYRTIFEKNNDWKEIYSANCDEYNCLDDRFFIRVFEKIYK